MMSLNIKCNNNNCGALVSSWRFTLQWRHNGRDGVSNHWPRHRLHSHLFRHRSTKTSKLRVTGLCVGNSSAIGEFTAQMVSDAENVSIWWRHHDRCLQGLTVLLVSFCQRRALPFLKTSCTLILVRVYTVLSFFYFMIENRKRVPYYHFPFSQSTNKKRKIEIWSVIHIFVFSFARWKKEKRKSTLSSIYRPSVFRFPNP